MNNTWIVVPVISNDVDLSSFVDSLSGGYTAPEFFEKMVFNQETQLLEKEEVSHPYFDQASPDFSNRVIFINKVAGYTKYDGVKHIEDFENINIYRYWNTGFEYAISNGADSVVLLNGVVDLDTFAIKDAYDVFVADGKEVVNIADGAMVLISATSSIRADEQFQIWFGDNDLYRTAENVSTVSRSEFFQLNYLVDPKSIENFDSIVASDQAKYNAKWN